MIISNNQIRSLLALYSQQEAKSPQASKKELSKIFNEELYKNAVSQDAEAYTNAREVIRGLPEIREDRLASIEQKVKSGTYEITDEEVAEKMIGRSLVDKLV
ncbi:MAG: hypothetical protein CVU89_05250 [Firmicutes bacterium HGW-Firmicutes-14]|nr:MAG: hypothetical protein CVU89_05250 [Firmicutes bacterium HGW-Firmicutes-14]